MKPESYAVLLINSKALDARRRGATTEAYGAIRRKPVESLQVEREERSKATPQMMPSWWIRAPQFFLTIKQVPID
jgi:hypothetical protein